MKYYVVNFKIICSSSNLDLAQDLLADDTANIGFDSFETTPCGLKGYIKENLLNIKDINDICNNFILDNVKISYSVEQLPDKNWNETWEKSGFETINIENKCIVYDAKHNQKEDIYKNTPLVIGIETQQAFGTGSHQTTQMVIEEMLSSNLKNKSFLDCGCGTGILSILAKKMGAKDIFAYDIDQWAINNAKHNFKLNNISNFNLLKGNADVINKINKMFDVVVANINRNILIMDMPHYAATMKNNSLLILSGFLEEDVEQITDNAKKYKLMQVRVRKKNNWACITLKKQIISEESAL